MKKLRPGLRWTLVFFALFLFFALGHRFYVESTLTVSVESKGPCKLRLDWDGGHGYTSASYDERTCEFGKCKFGVPQLNLRELRLQSVDSPASCKIMSAELTNDRGATPLTLSESGHFPILIRDLAVHNARFHSYLLITQLVLAAVCALAIRNLLSKVRRVGGLRSFFTGQKRPWFWAMFGLYILFFGVWFLYEFPAALGGDGVWGWNETKNLQFTDWHPYLFHFYLLATQQFADSPATAAAVQIVLSAASMSYVFYFALTRGAPRWAVAFAFALFSLSIPIGVWNVTLLKDVPFTIGVTWFCFQIYRLRLEQLSTGEKPRFRWSLDLLIAAVAATQFRHNGLIFYVLFPAMLALVCSRKDWLKIGASFLLLAFALRYYVPRHQGFKADGFQRDLEFKLASVITIMKDPNHYTQDAAADLKEFETLTPWWRGLELYDVYNGHVVSWAVPMERRSWQARRVLGDLHRRLVIDNLPIFLAEKTKIFLATLGFAGVSDHYSNGLALEPKYFLGYPRLNCTYFEYHPLLPSRILSGLKRLRERVEEYHGLLSVRTLIWSYAIPLVLVVAGLLAALVSGNPVGFFLLPILANSGVVFLLSSSTAWRYHYPLFFCAPAVLALVYCHRAARKRAHESSDPPYPA